MPTISVIRRGAALATLVGGAVSFASACSYDWDVGPGDGGSTLVETGPDGAPKTDAGSRPVATDTCRPTEPSCSFTCSPAAPSACVVDCLAGSDCSATCSRGGCTFRCQPGAICDFTCSGGKCTYECPSGALCRATCTGGGCQLLCGLGSCDDVTCTGGGCTRTSL